jgi:hypothetical protein
MGVGQPQRRNDAKQYPKNSMYRCICTVLFGERKKRDTTDHPHPKTTHQTPKSKGNKHACSSVQAGQVNVTGGNITLLFAQNQVYFVSIL